LVKSQIIFVNAQTMDKNILTVGKLEKWGFSAVLNTTSFRQNKAFFTRCFIYNEQNLYGCGFCQKKFFWETKTIDIQ